MIKVLLLAVIAFMLVSCTKNEITTEQETLQSTDLTSRQLNTAWQSPSNDTTLNTLLTNLSQENVIVTDTWDRKGRNSRQALLIIPKSEVTNRPEIDVTYKFYDSAKITELNGLASNLWIAFVLDDGINRTITDGNTIIESITVDRGKVYRFQDGAFAEYN